MPDLVTPTTTAIEPISASADGTRNAYSMPCDFTNQVMSYAACLWRQGVLSKPDIKTPADWAQCSNARNCNRCVAVDMRSEEELAGKAIYFRDRNFVRATARRWGDSIPAVIARVAAPVVAAVKSVISPASAKPAPNPAKSMLDAMGSAGDLSDALTKAAERPTVAPKSTRAQPPVIHANKAGESPLEMARRLAGVSK